MRISVVAWWTSAHRFMVDGVAVRSTATRFANAWVQAQLVDALPVEWTVVVFVAFSGCGSVRVLGKR